MVNIGINESDREAISKGLGTLLADTYTLYLTTHNFHWNVTGPLFNSLKAQRADGPLAHRASCLEGGALE